MKYLFVGDVHNHSYIFEDVKRLDEKYKFNRIIFMGDYVDDWLTDNHNSLETLNTVFNLKENEPNKYTFLLGNHELSYLGYECSGHDYNLDDVMTNKLKENIDKLNFYTVVKCNDKDYVCTHAGITNDYIKNMLDEENNWQKQLENINNDKINNLYMLSVVSSSRGGNCPFSSFVWADYTEHIYYNKIEKPIVPYQIIGHTPVKTVLDENNFIFIDTHSTYRDGRPFGDKSYLMWDEDIFKIIS